MEPDQKLKIDIEIIEDADTGLEAELPASTVNLLGTVLDDKIRIDSLIGRGGMSVVYKGTHLVLNRPVAVKVILPEAGMNSKAVMRLQQEAKTAFSLSHKNLASVHDISQTSDGLTYLVMDFAEGQTLADLYKNGPLDAPRAVEIFSQIAAGLKAAHSQGVIHRDIKPSNVMVESLADGSCLVKIVDFGIAKRVTESADEIQKLTQTGEIFGTPLYMSPEQCRGEMLDARSDIYSLGCVFYEALTGFPPFKGDTAVSTVLQHLSQKPPPPDRELKIPTPILKVLNTCLEKHQRDRYQTIDELDKDLQAIKYGGTIASLPSAGVRVRLKACLIDALIVATIGGLLFLPQAGYLFFSDIGQPAAAANFGDWRFDKFVNHFVLPSYLIGFGIGFAEGWCGLFCLFLVVGQLISATQVAGSQSISSYLLFTWFELLALATFNWLYHAVLESSEWQGTPGKVILNLRVTTSDGHRLSFAQASVRHLGRCFLSFCMITVLPIIALAARLCLKGKLAEVLPILSNLDNSLSHCDVRERHTVTAGSRKVWSATVATIVMLPLIGVVSTCFVSSANPEVAAPSKINTPHNIPEQAYMPVSRTAGMVTGYLLDPHDIKPEHLNQVWSPQASQSARSFALPVSEVRDSLGKSLQGIDLTEIDIEESTSDQLIPVTVAGQLHVLVGKQTWMSTRYKRVPFSIGYMIRWDKTSSTAEPVVVQVTKFVHGQI